jgi:hypothetical protein
MTTILIPVSPAELIDKITILELKKDRIADPTKLTNIEHELVLLRAELVKLPASSGLHDLMEALRTVNEAIWDAEEALRAGSPHQKNDERFRVKRAINELLGSAITEEKSHQT